ncbi:MAG: hypothetical protein COA99_07200, partial [Moraxellaceae bacterium]
MVEIPPIIEEPIASIPGSATFAWSVPKNRENGDALNINELNGYKILARNVSNDTEQTITINDPTVTQWQLTGLASGVWTFSIAAVDTQGTYSNYSSVASKTVIGEEPIETLPPIVEEPVIEEPVAEIPPVVEDPVAEEPIVEEPIAEKPAADISGTATITWSRPTNRENGDNFAATDLKGYKIL